jgi:NADP-dependent 3-hydroxy acid dehydrogenase YdfG
MFAGQTWWIVGASEGLGRDLALALARAGAKVIASARNLDRLTALAAEADGITPVAIDVTDATSVQAACDRVGVPDGILYCAGAYAPMSARVWQAEPAVAIAEVNFIGALRVLGHVVPAMLARKAGHVVLIGSLAGFRGLPDAIGYGASKSALMHLAENMRADLRGTGVRVQVINPGFIKTRLTAQNDFAMPQIMSPEAAAGHVLAAMQTDRFSTSFPAPFAWLFRFGRYLPLGLFQRMF